MYIYEVNKKWNVCFINEILIKFGFRNKFHQTIVLSYLYPLYALSLSWDIKTYIFKNFRLHFWTLKIKKIKNPQWQNLGIIKISEIYIKSSNFYGPIVSIFGHPLFLTPSLTATFGQEPWRGLFFFSLSGWHVIWGGSIIIRVEILTLMCVREWKVQ